MELQSRQKLRPVVLHSSAASGILVASEGTRISEDRSQGRQRIYGTPRTLGRGEAELRERAALCGLWFVASSE